MRAVPTRRLALAGALLGVCALVAGCGVDVAASALTSAGANSAPASPSIDASPTVSPEPTPTTSPTATDTPTASPSPQATDTPTPTPSPTASPSPVFHARVEPISPTLRARMIEVGSWRPGCPVAIRDLRLLTLTYWGFDGRPHQGRLVVARAMPWKLARVFKKLFERRFPIRRMRLIEYYGASDDRSMAADNTSAFNGRYVSGTRRWSMHAYGIAIDINPVENPYVSGSHVSPPAGKAFVNRSLRRRGMIRSGDAVVRAFAAIGWEWGGYWRPARDYQHFSANGR